MLPFIKEAEVETESRALTRFREYLENNYCSELESIYDDLSKDVSEMQNSLDYKLAVIEEELEAENDEYREMQKEAKRLLNNKRIKTLETFKEHLERIVF